MHRRTYTEALLAGKCPRCRQGNVFSYPATNLLQFDKMNASCPHCQVRLEPEPGFYQGAMYVGYAFTVAAILLVGSLLFLLGDPATWVYIVALIGVMVLLAPLNFRYSRICYLYFFGGIKYEPQPSQTK